MSLSRLEKDQVEAESARVELLKAKALAKEVDETKLRKKVNEDEREHTRYSVKGAQAAPKVLPALLQPAAAAAGRPPATALTRPPRRDVAQRWRTTSGTTRTAPALRGGPAR